MTPSETSNIVVYLTVKAADSGTIIHHEQRALPPPDLTDGQRIFRFNSFEFPALEDVGRYIVEVSVAQ